MPDIPANTNTVIAAADEYGDEIFLDSSGFDTPSRLLYGHGRRRADRDQDGRRRSSTPTDIEVTQHFATSADGTAIPYFVVGHRARMDRDRRCSAATADSRIRRPRRTAVCSAGSGWRAAAPTCWPTSAAAASTGRAGTPRRCAKDGTWSPRTSPRWQADLVRRGITTVDQLGAQGGSNGGLLMGIMLTQYPELFGALVCSVPLLDMRRFHLLLAGASWVAEYGDPDDPDDWEFISKYSPYQNISADRSYPAGADHHLHPRRPGASRATPGR